MIKTHCIHWVDAKTAKTATVIEYDRLFTMANPMQAEHFTDAINPNSKNVRKDVLVEASLHNTKAGDVFHFFSCR